MIDCICLMSSVLPHPDCTNSTSCPLFRSPDEQVHAVLRQQVSLEYLQQLHELHEQWLVEDNFDDVSQMAAVRPQPSLSELTSQSRFAYSATGAGCVPVTSCMYAACWLPHNSRCPVVPMHHVQPAAAQVYFCCYLCAGMRAAPTPGRIGWSGKGATTCFSPPEGLQQVPFCSILQSWHHPSHLPSVHRNAVGCS